LNLMGATGETTHQAKIFIYTLSPGFIFLGGALACSFSLRGLGDARRAMYVTLSSAIITLILDPIFIFVFGWGIAGAAAANAISYALCFCVGIYGLRFVHKFHAPFTIAGFKRDFPSIWAIALPTVIAQLATPFAAGYMNYAMAPYGDEIVAAGTVVNRVVPVAFGVVFALSGAVGPIIGQNFGAKNFSRVKRTLRDGLVFATIYSVVMAFLLFLLSGKIIEAFHVTGRAAELVSFFTTWISVSWAFIGGLFVASAAFNNLGKPVYSTWANWGRATLGTVPFAILGAAWAGPAGIMVGTAIGGALFGLGAMIMAYRLVHKISASAPSGA
jgi:putative MATE family efflux protein